MAIPAAAASACTSTSSSSVNGCPLTLSARYRLPNTLSRMRIGTPRNVRIGGWFGGKPTEAGCSRDVVQPNGCGVFDEQAHDASAFG